MKNTGRLNFVWIIICVLILWQSNGAYCSEPVGQFPPAKFTLPAPDSPQVQEYLGLRTMEPFRISDIKSKLVVVEFMDAHCTPCHVNAPIMNYIYDTIQSDSRIDDVKIIGVAVANETGDVETYKKEFNTPFPILLDKDAAILVAMDGVQTPTTMIISTENSEVLLSESGVIKDSDKFVKQLIAFQEGQ